MASKESARSSLEAEELNLVRANPIFLGTLATEQTEITGK
jgi:hypothetical protein